ncbi:substrate-binding domain-containing protein [Actinomadura rugatobispora]|uniref:Substrate-binding domain-containing protein n=1 Tax=Actinomadura rugatobispora TaxID=1994 RepID=A0ABW1A947_9ACTN|nr:substrate-binding domain-containing protein [Actinomadura rugatobispora]
MNGHDDDVPDWIPHARPGAGALQAGHRRTAASVPRAPGSTGPGRHIAPPPARRRGGLLWGPLAGAAGLTVLAGLGVFALAGGAGCGGEDALTLNVAAAPEIAPAVTRAAGRFNDAGHEFGGRCARARVTGSDPAAVSTLLSGRGVAGVTERPDVWVPDSSLWTVLAQARAAAPEPGAGQGTGPGPGTITRGRSMAASPIVVAMPATIARRLGAPGGAQPSWRELLTAAGATEEGAAPGTGPSTGPGAGPSRVPPGLVRLKVPDPNRTATGMGSLVLANLLLNASGDGNADFTGVVRTLRESVTPSVRAEFASFRPDRQGRHPVALAPEQAVYEYNARKPAEPAVAVYPSEGTLAMDYQVTRIGAAGAAAAADADPRARAARELERELTGEETRADVLGLGFRAPDARAPAAFGARTGVDPRPPRALPAPPAADVQRIMQSWARLSLSIRMLSVIDVSGSMEEEVAPGVDRLQSTVRTAQSGLSLLPDDTELGQWVFSTGLRGDQDWRELVSVGPLGERLGSATRRQLILSAFARIRAKRNGDTGLYDTIMAAFEHMKRTYKPEFVNSVLLWTDGRDDDPGGPGLRATLDRLRAAYDPDRPIQVIMFGYGRDVDVDELRQIARATRGDVLVAQTPGEVQKLFLQAVSRRVCAPSC